MNAPRPPQKTYQCVNTWCPRYLRPRTVTLQHIGQGLYLDALPVCECGKPVRLVKHPRPEKSIVRDPAKRVDPWPL